MQKAKSRRYFLDEASQLLPSFKFISPFGKYSKETISPTPPRLQRIRLQKYNPPSRCPRTIDHCKFLIFGSFISQKQKREFITKLKLVYSQCLYHAFPLLETSRNGRWFFLSRLAKRDDPCCQRWFNADLPKCVPSLAANESWQIRPLQ